jgi:sulfoxide reductase heme-binding subunit YedZ
MIPLALTSTAGMIRRLGKRWQQLHRLIYLAAIAAVIHFYWLVKSDIRRPVQFGAVLTLLLGYRLVVRWLKPSRSRISRAPAVARSRELS